MGQHIHRASMKAPPKRKGNNHRHPRRNPRTPRLNESPSEKEGKCQSSQVRRPHRVNASMKAPPKRKGNAIRGTREAVHGEGLNESPSEKEGK